MPGFSLQKLTVQYQKDLPFVAYRKPDKSLVKILLQKEDSNFSVGDFTEKGFVFAPFDLSGKNYFIPFEEVDYLEIPFENPKSEKPVSKKTRIDLGKKSTHIHLVQKGIDAIKAGGFQKVVLSRKQEVELHVENPLQIFSNLLQTYPTAFVYCWFHPETGLWMGATPESLLKVESDSLKTMALAGTQKYNGTTEVSWGEKEKEEQRLVTDFILSELKDKLKYLNLSEVETIRAGNLLHLNTSISGKFSNLSSDGQDPNLKEIIQALHPTPAVCGLPKNAAKKFILQNENYDREYYTGFLGELNFPDNKTDLYVNLRCMKIEKGKASLYVGGGITKDSNPEDEWKETLNKAETMLRVL